MIIYRVVMGVGMVILERFLVRGFVGIVFWKSLNRYY